MVPRLLEVFFPLLLEVLVHGTAQRGRIDLDTPPLGLERLIQELVHLFLLLHRRLPLGSELPVPRYRPRTMSVRCPVGIPALTAPGVRRACPWTVLARA